LPQTSATHVWPILANQRSIANLERCATNWPLWHPTVRHPRSKRPEQLGKSLRDCPRDSNVGFPPLFVCDRSCPLRRNLRPGTIIQPALFRLLLYSLRLLDLQLRYLPRTIGILLSVAGVGYAAYSLAQMLAPTFAAKLLFPWLLLPGFFAELGLCLWLIVKGVNVIEWRERTKA